ncbi:sulfotransferase domain-containing protein [Salinibacter ruber]|uniref:sulfotransferase domain-containing protein n=1 Tax=Salinibacter ruber TaxID=146919 RepID=UPI002073532D|nr:sulfotransferase domain-containing protein [Salinibacter ruber]
MSSNQFDLSFVAVGPQRTGTTWLYEMLRCHSQICMPEAVKETMFFDKRFGRGIEWYTTYFDYGREEQINGEIAPTYFDVAEVPKRIRKIASDCEIIIGLRHPAERAFSLYLHHLRKGRVPNSFWEAVKEKPRIITAGHYSKHIPRWRSFFEERQIHFVFLSDIKSEPEEVLDQVCRYLKVKPMRPPRQTSEKVNAASMPRSLFFARAVSFLTTMLHALGFHRIVELGKKLGLRKLAYSGAEEEMPVLRGESRKQLIDEYEEDIEYVERITGRCLTHWRE